MNPRTLALRVLLGLTLLALIAPPASADWSGDLVILIPLPAPGGSGMVFVPVLMANVVVDPGTSTGAVPPGTTGPDTQEPAMRNLDDPSPTPG